MKASQKDFNGLAPRFAGQAKVFFFCGPDEAGAGDAAFLTASLLPDAGERVEISGAELRKDPVKLGDEARSTSLFGGNRHIWVRASGDEACEAVTILLSNDVEACPVIIIATSATDKPYCQVTGIAQRLCGDDVLAARSALGNRCGAADGRCRRPAG